MHCFVHNSVEAVGICRRCAKGVCPECLVDFVTGIACKGACVDAVKALDGLVARNVRSAGGAAIYFTPFIYFLFGISFFAWAAVGGATFLYLLGGVFLLGAGWSFFNIRRYQRPITPPQN